MGPFCVPLLKNRKERSHGSITENNSIFNEQVCSCSNVIFSSTNCLYSIIKDLKNSISALQILIQAVLPL